VYNISPVGHRLQRRRQWQSKNSSARCATSSAPDIIATRLKKVIFAGCSNMSLFIIKVSPWIWESRKLPPFLPIWPPGKTSPHQPGIKPWTHRCAHHHDLHPRPQSRRIWRTRPPRCPEIIKAPTSSAFELDRAFITSVPSPRKLYFDVTK